MESSSVAVLPAVRALLERLHGNFIDGRILPARSGKSMAVFDPATGAQISRVADSAEADIDDAVTAAQGAFKSWSRTRPADRERLLCRLADLIQANSEELAQLETLNQGKSINLSRAVDLNHTVEFCRYMAGWATKIEGSTIDVSMPAAPGKSYKAFTLREPVGVVGAIVPWNFPLIMAIWKIAPALACGCTVVLKPADETPLTALRLAELCLEAGIPNGVVNIVTGRGETAGAALARHKGIQKIAFTGSTEVGKLIGHAAVDNLTRMSLELGGKSPMIVLGDVPPQEAAEAAAMGILFNQGQVCTAASRLFVHESIFHEVSERLAAAMSGAPFGPGMDPSSAVNPVVSARHRERIEGFVAQAAADGARTLRSKQALPAAGFYVAPTLVLDAADDHRIVREEVFGPVVVATPFKTLEEAAARANASAYGLSASVWTNNLRDAMNLVPELRAGTVWVNSHNMVDPNMPFGGFKQSGFGREMGRSAIESYTELKSVCMHV
ncbi:MAG TPA: aldehyde dehydrogenase family protein [Ramlibacter sp.]|nr:aldehyde dehydrogenase family protein [Ramlibacter sp.]